MPSSAPSPEAIEILLRNRAYVVKRVGTEDGAGSGDRSLKGKQYTWSKHGGPMEAWDKAVEAAGWPESEL